MTYRHAPREPLRAVIFDLDGTLVDSSADIASALNQALAQTGLAAVPLEAVRRMIGDGVLALARKALEYRHAAADAEACQRLADRFLAIAHAVPITESALFPGTDALLGALKTAGLKIGVCTNKPHALAEQVLQALGVDARIDAWIGGGRFAMKPDPASLMAVIEALGATADSTVYVGDMRVDYLTALNADVAFVGVNFGYWRHDLPNMDEPFLVEGAAGLASVLLPSGGGV